FRISVCDIRLEQWRMFNRSVSRLALLGVCVLVAVVGTGDRAQTQGDSAWVGYTSDNPVVFDNDAVTESYFDEYFFALASQGVIDLRGAITTNSWKEQGECREGSVNADSSDRAPAIPVAPGLGRGT